jgi:hypothetical protein
LLSPLQMVELGAGQRSLFPIAASRLTPVHTTYWTVVRLLATVTFLLK